nr:MAG TPA: hypothetical protein [Caudoviricetes sp.]
MCHQTKIIALTVETFMGSMYVNIIDEEVARTVRKRRQNIICQNAHFLMCG